MRARRGTGSFAACAARASRGHAPHPARTPPRAGSWSGFGSSFSVAYYTQLIGSQWSSKDAPTGGWLTSAPPPGPPGDPQLVMMKGPDVELMISPSDACPSFQELNFTTPTPTPPPGQRCPVNAINQAALTDFARNQTLWWSVFTEAWTVRARARACVGWRPGARRVEIAIASLDAIAIPPRAHAVRVRL